MTVARPQAARRFERLRPLLPWLLATWFFVISAMRLIVVIPGGPGLDGRLYRAATASWLTGGDPWMVSVNGVFFGAPPPSLLPMVPFALVPEWLGVGAIVALSILGSLWAFRRLGIPWWWIAFPPLVDGIWNANPHVLVLPLLVARLIPLAVFAKIYAGVVPAIRLSWRPLMLTAAALFVTAPLLPWATYIADLQFITTQFRVISQGGLSVWSLPPPLSVAGLVVGLVALAILTWLQRERAAWIAMPVFWPWTEWYYSSLAIPALKGEGAWMVAAAIMAIPIEGGPVLGIIALSVIALAKRRRSRDSTSEGIITSIGGMTAIDTRAIAEQSRR